MNEFGQGLTLSGIGILITFSALGILILLILILKALFPAEENDLDLAGLEEPAIFRNDASKEEIRMKAAAAGVAVLLRKSAASGKGGLGSELEKPVNAWWQQGLDRIQGKE